MKSARCAPIEGEAAGGTARILQDSCTRNETRLLRDTGDARLFIGTEAALQPSPTPDHTWQDATLLR